MRISTILIALLPIKALTVTIQAPDSGFTGLAARHSPGGLTGRSCAETAARVCFGINGGTAQNINMDDILYAADYLRALSAANGSDPLWTMPSEADCSEWTLPIYEAQTALVLVKHISPQTNSSYSYLDLARTIDGGEDATAAQRASSLLGACGKNGGMMGILVDESDPAYGTTAYKASGAKHQRMIMKIVRAPGS